MSQYDAQLDRIERLLTDMVRLTTIAIALLHEWLDRPPPEMRHTVNVPAWSRAQIERIVIQYMDIRDKIAKERGR